MSSSNAVDVENGCDDELMNDGGEGDDVVIKYGVGGDIDVVDASAVPTAAPRHVVECDKDSNFLLVVDTKWRLEVYVVVNADANANVVGGMCITARRCDDKRYCALIAPAAVARAMPITAAAANEEMCRDGDIMLLSLFFERPEPKLFRVSLADCQSIMRYCTVPSSLSPVTGRANSHHHQYYRLVRSGQVRSLLLWGEAEYFSTVVR